MATITKIGQRKRFRGGGLARQPICSILESGPGFGSLGRFNIYAGKPRAVFRVDGGDWSLSEDWPGQRPATDVDPFEALRFLLKQTRRDAPADVPFAGGWIGYLGYDLAPLLERLPRRLARTSKLPDLYLGYHTDFAVIDHEEDTFSLHSFPFASEAEGTGARALDELAELLSEREVSLARDAFVTKPPASLFTREAYEKAVETVLEYIRAGDIFQANLAHRFEAPWSGEVGALYDHLRLTNPAPFSALLRLPEADILSTSPERFLSLDPTGRVETRPIKGTRPRGRDAVLDLWLREELSTSEKDRAELAMIVDLERNDLGRVCEYGSIRVTQHAALESYASVHHLVSRVEGKLRADRDIVDLIKACFPGGSITGAPKIRAMEIIDELEPVRRGVYTGAIGYISDHGRSDWNIAIRTLVIENGLVHYHVGGGIVADSIPTCEYDETLAKGQRLFTGLMAR